MRILLTGARGMLGSSIAEHWRNARPDDELIAVTRHEVDLRDEAATAALFRSTRPDAVIHAAAFVGGIGDKLARPLPYLQENLRLDASVIAAAVAVDTSRFVYIASAAAYPAEATSPIAETALFQGALEPANEGYGLAKLSGITAVKYAAQQTGAAYRSLLPSNLYGPGDTFDPDRAHLIASTLRKTHEAKERREDHVSVWGDGTARREFTYAPDIAAWLTRAVDDAEAWPQTMNIGSGIDHSVREYYEVARELVGYDGELRFDVSKPSGVPRRLIDSTAARRQGWSPTTTVTQGMSACYGSYLSKIANGELR